ncbi:MAG: zinc-dependent metalloprotease [Aeromicrobium sp.]|nr:zinc-dependent metalloprotease [Burkholderiales bacterium]
MQSFLTVSCASLSPLVRKTLVAAVIATLTSTAFAQTPAPAPAGAPVPPAPGTVAAPGAPAAGAPTPSAPRPFKEIIKDAKKVAGFFDVYQKDEKVWLAIKPEQFDKPFFFTYNIPQSVGERGLYGSQMGGAEMAVFRKIGTQIQLIAKNTEFYAAPGTPQAQFVSESFSDSLLGSATAASAPDTDSKAVLIDASAILFADIPGYLTRLEFAYRMPFALDARNSSFSQVTNNEMITAMKVQAHFNVPRISAPPLVPSPVPMPTPPQATPDPRSMFVSFMYSFAKLPDQPMAARAADERVGHFVSSRVNYDEDLSPKTKQHYVNRWRLEKKDPAAALSEPKQPITYWLDKNIPVKYRKAVQLGILEWNKAFEKIGFKNAIVAKQQTEKDDFDTMDARHASIRWFTGADVGFAIGPSHKDPRTGEILDADIGMSDVFARGARRLVVEDIGKPMVFDSAMAGAMSPTLKDQSLFMQCNYMTEKAHDLHFAMDILEARGMDMDSPEAEQLAQDYVLDVIMHEVGHTLGFRHNFRSSTIYSVKQIQDPKFTKVNGLAGSVMDYNPFNLAVKGDKQGEYVMSTLGPYDYLAVEYAYKPLDPKTEKTDLAAIAAQATTNPVLAYATDEDAGGFGGFNGMDPEVNRFDMGSDPIEYYKKRMTLSRELWDRIQTLQLKPGESYERLTRSFASGFRSIAQVAPLLAKYVGGVKHVRDRAGTSNALYTPTPVAKQRESLQLVTDSLFKVESFKFKPEFVSRLSIDHFDRNSMARINPDVSISNSVMNLQRGVLDILYADNVAQRLLDSQDKVSNPAQAMKLSEVYDTLQNAIWSELRTGGDISVMRRNLQRDHIRRIGNALTRSAATAPADARSLMRENAIQLQGQIRAAMAKPMSKEAKAHLSESMNTLAEALKAPLARAGA